MHELEPQLSTPSDDPLDLSRELLRKLIHVGTIAVPLLVWALPPASAVTFLSTGAGLALVVEGARRWSRPVRYFFLTRAGKLLRHHERKGLAGATYMAIGYLLVYLLFPLPVALAAMLYNSVGDAMAAVVGKRWGYHRVSWGKSWEGAGAGLGANLLVGLAVPGLPLASALLGALGAAALEFLPIPFDDNIRVTVGGGFAGWLGFLLILG